MHSGQQITQIIEQVRAIQAGSGFILAAEDEAAITRVLTGQTIVEQEREQVLAELTAARGGPPAPGEPLNGNLLGLTDPSELHIAERRLTSCRMAELFADPSVIDRQTPMED